MSKVDMSSIPMVGVWWDINTCPVPDDVDPRSIRLRIGSEMKKHIADPFRVVVFGVGNLEYVSLELLKKLSHFGIILVHATHGGNDVRNFLWCWSNRTPLSDTILLISCNFTWYLRSTWKHTVLYANLEGKLVTSDGKLFSDGDLVWEALLKNNPVDEKTILSNQHDVRTCVCHFCDDIFENCEDLIQHLKSNQHREEMYKVCRRDDDGKVLHFCECCKYPAYDDFNMDIHYDSDEHKMNLAKKEAQEEDCESRKRTLDEDLLNEANKKR